MEKTINIPTTIRYDGEFCNDKIDMCKGRENEDFYKKDSKSITNCSIFEDELIYDFKYNRVRRCEDCINATKEIKFEDGIMRKGITTISVR